MMEEEGALPLALRLAAVRTGIVSEMRRCGGFTASLMPTTHCPAATPSRRKLSPTVPSRPEPSQTVPSQPSQTLPNLAAAWRRQRDMHRNAGKCDAGNAGKCRGNAEKRREMQGNAGKMQGNAGKRRGNAEKRRDVQGLCRVTAGVRRGCAGSCSGLKGFAGGFRSSAGPEPGTSF